MTDADRSCTVTVTDVAPALTATSAKRSSGVSLTSRRTTLLSGRPVASTQGLSATPACWEPVPESRPEGVSPQPLKPTPKNIAMEPAMKGGSLAPSEIEFMAR